jgi:DNA modification methylase
VAESASRLEELMPAEELVFPPTPGFGKYRRFLEHAMPHPAKMNVELLEFLVLKYSREGDLILDPMAGTGSTCVIAALNGRDAVCVEIEPRFYEWMEEARKRVEAHKTLRRKGRIVNVLGDARRLSELLKQADAIVTSPPYGDTYLGGGDPVKRVERLVKAGHDPREFLGGRARNAVLKHYSDVDTVITSPPYAQTISHRSGGSNVRVVGVGISTITARTYSTSDDNVGNLPLGDVDAIITSPPYESALEGTSRHTRGGIASRDPKLARSGTYSTVLSVKPGVPVMYSPNPDNIGNLKNSDKDYELLEREEDINTLYSRLLRDGKPTYLSEMLLVYKECFKVLKPGGNCVVVVKPFIRDKKVVDLPYYTWLLMERAGFKLGKLHKFRLPTKSFWRKLYYRKYPEVPEIAHEYVIVAVKQG